MIKSKTTFIHVVGNMVRNLGTAPVLAVILCVLVASSAIAQDSNPSPTPAPTTENLSVPSIAPDFHPDPETVAGP